MDKMKLINRITCDLDTRNINSLIRCLKVFKRYGFTKELTVKLSSSRHGFHVISWSDKGVSLKKLLKIRKKAGDDNMRCFLDSRSTRMKQVLFDTKTKSKTDLMLDGIPMEYEVKGEETNTKISFGEI